MSSGNPGGAPNLKLKAKHAPNYPPGAIKSERDADFTGVGPSGSVGIKLGIRVKKKSPTDFQKPTLILTTRATPGHPGTIIPLTGPLLPGDPIGDPIAADLAKGLGCDSDELWVPYTLSWNPSLGLKFDSILTLAPFPYPPFVTDNGFEIVTVAFCHASQKFEDGVYSYAVSVLPGKNSSGLPMSLPQASSGKKGSKKSTKKPKAKAKSKKKYRR